MNLRERFEVVPQPKQPSDVLALLKEVQHSPFIGEISSQEIARLRDANAVLFFYDGNMLGCHW